MFQFEDEELHSGDEQMELQESSRNQSRRASIHGHSTPPRNYLGSVAYRGAPNVLSCLMDDVEGAENQLDLQMQNLPLHMAHSTPSLLRPYVEQACGRELRRISDNFHTEYGILHYGSEFDRPDIVRYSRSFPSATRPNPRKWERTIQAMSPSELCRLVKANQQPPVDK